uniref:Uncharacterized protein n=1 Tax=Leptospira santarosai serovar Arenal str. MAVJ 401 TaxID=1049976 RepID=M6JIC5_9LEPT|nr:hypothetical protein LEP1GSC063_4033 [Leptospira santarosai serovar Arenal str. MAVJ 401]
MPRDSSNERFQKEFAGNHTISPVLTVKKRCDCKDFHNSV